MSAAWATGSLWSPAFRNVFAAQVVSIFGDGLVPVALAILLLLGSSPLAARAALQCAHGAATAVANPATSGLVAEIVPVRSLQRPTAFS